MGRIADLRATFRETKAKWIADKSDKKAKKAYRAAKTALAEAKEAAANKKMSAGEIKQPKMGCKKRSAGEIKQPKMGHIVDLRTTFRETKAKWIADKSDKKAKQAYREAKTALAEAKEAAFWSVGEIKQPKMVRKKSSAGEIKQPKMGHIIALRTTFREAKAKWLADKSDRKAKKAYREATTALAEAFAAKKAEAFFTNKKRSAGEIKQPPKKKKKIDDSQNPPSKKIYLTPRNTEFKIDDKKIKEFLEDCGELVNIHWMNQRKGTAIIAFATRKAADRAISKNGTDFLGQPFGCHYARARAEIKAKKLSEKPPGCDSIFVGNLARDVDYKRLKEYFEDCGDIKKIMLMINKKTGVSKGKAFVQFTYPDLALPIAVKHNGRQLSGRTMCIDYSKPLKKKYGDF